jgi:peptidyl-prolyl cis-trans isomerase B (cyclophilin B)
VIATVLALLVGCGALGVFAVVGAVVNAVDSADDQPDSAWRPVSTPTPEQTPDQYNCQFEPVEDTSGLNPGLPPAGFENYPRTATIETNLGRIEMNLADEAPCAVRSFTHLADRGFYAGTTCHRLTTQQVHVLQCGDPTGTGTGGPGYQFAIEPPLPSPVEGEPYPVGSVAMSNTGEPDSNGSQFFFVYGATRIPPDYTPIAVVILGMEVIQKVAAAGHDGSLDPTPGGGKPKKPLRLITVTVQP